MSETSFEQLEKFDGYYGEEDLKEFSDMLDEKFVEARHSLEMAIERVQSTSHEATGDTSHSLQMADQGTDAMEREKAFLFAQRDEKYLKQMQVAQERVKNKIFGICRDCGVKIKKARMMAVPTTNICISCKTENELRKRR